MKITFTLTPEQMASMIPYPNKIYTYHSYDMRGFDYHFSGTPSEYKTDREKRFNEYREAQIGYIKFRP